MILDSNTSTGWIRKSHSKQKGENIQPTRIKQYPVRGSAKNIDFQIREYSQKFPEDKKHVDDLISQDDHISDTNLIFI